MRAETNVAGDTVLQVAGTSNLQHQQITSQLSQIQNDLGQLSKLNQIQNDLNQLKSNDSKCMCIIG